MLNCFYKFKTKSEVIANNYQTIIENLSNKWELYFGFEVIEIPNKIWIQESLLNKINKTFPILSVGITRLHPNQIYDLHIDENRGVCVNMKLNYNFYSECSFEVPGKTVIVPYEENTFFLFNNQLPHKVVNGDGTRYMFTIEFVKDKRELNYKTVLEWAKDQDL
jgi:hypothetical protein